METHSLQDVKSRRLPDVGSDHNLLIGKLALKLRKAKTGEKKKQRFDTVKLQNPETKQQFTIALKFWYSAGGNRDNYRQFQHGHRASRESSARLQKIEERAVDFHINLGKNRPKERNKEKLLTTKSPGLKERLSREYSQKRQRSWKEYQSRQTHLHWKPCRRHRRSSKKKGYEVALPNAQEAERKYRSKPESPTERCRWKDQHSREREDREVEGIFPTGSPSCRSTRTCRHPRGSRWPRPNNKQKSEKPLKPRRMEKHQEATTSAEMLKADEQETPRILCQIFQGIWDEEDTRWLEDRHNYQGTKEGWLGEL